VGKRIALALRLKRDFRIFILLPQMLQNAVNKGGETGLTLCMFLTCGHSGFLLYVFLASIIPLARRPVNFSGAGGAGLDGLSLAARSRDMTGKRTPNETLDWLAQQAGLSPAQMLAVIKLANSVRDEVAVLLNTRFQDAPPLPVAQSLISCALHLILKAHGHDAVVEILEATLEGVEQGLMYQSIDDDGNIKEPLDPNLN
jgi:hypothetical protein